jgi:hypothetical protein
MRLSRLSAITNRTIETIVPAIVTAGARISAA